MPLLKNSGYGGAPTYRLWVALILSLLLHLALLTKLGASSQNRGISNHLLQVRLATPAPLTPAPTKPEAANPIVSIKPQPETSPALKPHEKIAPLPTPPLNTTQKPPAAETPRQIEQRPEIPVPDQNAPASWVDIEFDIFSGKEKKLIGTGLQHYESDGLGQYNLSFKENNVPAEQAQRHSWQLEIAGRITRRGLSPSSYQRQGNMPKQLMALDNNSATNAEDSDASQAGRMPDGILDRQSLLFQFMFSPPTETDGELSLTDGDKVVAYDYHTVGMETIEVKSQGPVRTLHVVLSGNESADTIELWLAPDFRYLPVKVRHTSSNGSVNEQLATSISFK